MKSLYPMRELSGRVSSFLLFALATFLVLLAFSFGHTPWMMHLSTHRSPAVSLLYLLAVILGATPFVPRLRRALKCSAIARRENARFLAAAESSMDDFYIFDGVPDASGNIVDFRFSYINPNAERRLNTRREALIGKILTDVRPFMTASGLIEHYREVVRTGLPFTAEVFIDDDKIKATWINLQVVRLGTGIAITSRDVTERKRLIDHISYLAHYDQVTGVANRTLLNERLQQAILHAHQNNQKIAVFLLDVDRFKHINDSLGHANGDSLLSAIAKRLVSSVDPSDTVARLGGDEFVILMPSFSSLEDVMRRGRQIVKAASLPVSIANREVTITVSMGLSIYPGCGLDASDLLNQADSAMYSVKKNGRNSVRIFAKRATSSTEENFAFAEDRRA